MIEGTETLTFFMMVLGKTLGADLEILEKQKRRLQLQQVYSVDECDVVLAFVSIVSRAGTDIGAALEKIPTHRPVVLVVIHNTFNPDQVVPDIMNKLHVMVMGNTKGSHKTFMDLLMLSTNFEIVNLEDQCDIIVAFVPVVSRMGTNIQEAMEKIPVNKQVVLVVLHHTFDPYLVAPDSKWSVNRGRVFAVDCLYHEDQGLLDCSRNEDAIKAVKQHLRAEENKFTSSVTWEQPEQSCVQYKNNNVGITPEKAICIIAFLFLVFMIYKLLF